MSRSFSLLIGFVFLGGCANNGHELHSIIDAHYVGQKADVFFEDNGPPQSQYQMDDGGKIYTWTTGDSHVQTPGFATFESNSYGGNTFGTVSDSGGTNFTYACDLNIYTKRDNTITRFRIARNKMSKCNSYFAHKSRKWLESDKP